MRWLNNRLLRNAFAAGMALAFALCTAGPAAAQKPGQQQPQQPSADVPTEVTIVNRSRMRIIVINISPVSDPNWGRDWLGQGVVLPPGRQLRFDITDAQSCAYDIRVIYQDRRAEELRNFDICAQSQLVFTGQNARPAGQAQPQQPQQPPPQPQQPSRDPFQRPGQPQRPAPPPSPATPPDEILVINRSQMRAVAINFSPVSDPNWGPNRLGRNTLGPRASSRYQIDASQGCNYDFRMVFEGQRAEEQRNVNICNANQIIFTGQNARPIQGQPQQPQAPQPEPAPQPTPAPPAPTVPPPPPPPAPPLPQPEPPSPPSPAEPPAESPPPVPPPTTIPQVPPAPAPTTPSPQQVPQGDPDFVLVNSSQMPIVAFNASPVTDPNWGEDRLRGAPIAPGAQHIVRLNSPGVCLWDVRVIYENRRAEERRNINLCETTYVPFTGENTREATP